MNQTEDDPPKKKFRVQRRRLGSIKRYFPDKEFGFIEGEDFRDDVFFHRRDWEGVPRDDDNARPVEPIEEMWVEFEIDDELFSTEKKLRAKVVRPSNRPEGRRLTAKDANFESPRHHPNARRKRPTWRNK